MLHILVSSACSSALSSFSVYKFIQPTLITIVILHVKLFYAISVDCSNSPLMDAYSLKLKRS